MLLKPKCESCMVKFLFSALFMCSNETATKERRILCKSKYINLVPAGFTATKHFL